MYSHCIVSREFAAILDVKWAVHGRYLRANSGASLMRGSTASSAGVATRELVCPILLMIPAKVKREKNH